MATGEHDSLAYEGGCLLDFLDRRSAPGNVVYECGKCALEAWLDADRVTNLETDDVCEGDEYPTGPFSDEEDYADEDSN